MRRYVFVALGIWALLSAVAFGGFEVGSEQLVAAGGAVIEVDGYSVPSYADWDGDGLGDLIVGQGGGYGVGKVRVYLNEGTAGAPSFSSWFFAQSQGSDLTVPAMGCLGIFPHVVDWDNDGKSDLLVGQANGKVRIFRNTNTDSEPMFDIGSFLQVGASGSKYTMSVGYRATPSVADWNNDGRKDVVSGGLDGRIHVFLNEGSDSTPDFVSETLAANSDGFVFGSRSSPVVMDLDGDGKKDLLVGDTSGRLFFYSNVGTDDAPVFGESSLVESDGVAIDLAGSPRSRPFVCDWNEDGYSDILVGAGDGYVHLFQGVPEPATILLAGLGAVMLRRKRRD